MPWVFAGAATAAAAIFACAAQGLPTATRDGLHSLAHSFVVVAFLCASVGAVFELTR